MKLSRRVTINTALGFSMYFALVSVVIYLSFADFRREEFVSRLEEKARTTGRLLLEVNEVSTDLLRIIDRNSYNKLVNEVLIVLDDQFLIEYASSDDYLNLWDDADLRVIKENSRLVKRTGNLDVLGLKYPVNQNDYYIIISAEDRYGNRKLNFIAYALSIAFLSSLLVIWIVNRFFIQQQMKPLEKFQEQISHFSFNPPLQFLPEDSKIDEIKELAKSYNNLLAKVTEAFQVQREFNSNASHELKTPITRMAFQTEGLLNDPNLSVSSKATIKQINTEIHQLSDLVNSLLLLSRSDNLDEDLELYRERIDDMIFEAYELVRKDFPDFEMSFSIQTSESGHENSLEINCVRPLLVTCFRNLLKNACVYSNDARAKLTIEVIDSNNILIHISNNGKVLLDEDRRRLFEPFARGNNSLGIQGYGLGLRMTKRILDRHGADIAYTINPDRENCFSIHFRN
jgi:two-component system sensor histidine kinase ArlS